MGRDALNLFHNCICLEKKTIFLAKFIFSKLPNVFVQIAKCICPNCKISLLKNKGILQVGRAAANQFHKTASKESLQTGAFSADLPSSSYQRSFNLLDFQECQKCSDLVPASVKWSTVLMIDKHCIVPAACFWKMAKEGFPSRKILRRQKTKTQGWFH